MADESKRRTRAPKASVESDEPTWAEGVTYRGPKPHFPVRGESWQEEIGGAVKWWHGTGWYLEAPEGEPGTVEAAMSTMAAQKREQAGAGQGDDAGTAEEGPEEPEEEGEQEPEAEEPEGEPETDPGVNDAEEEPEVVADLSEHDTELAAIDGDGEEEVELITEEGELTDDGANAMIADSMMRDGEREAEQDAMMDAGADAYEAEDEGGPSLVAERIEHFADDIELDAGFLVEDARDFMLDMFKTRPKPWSAMKEEEQRDVAAAIEQAMVEFVRKMVETIRADPATQPIRALLEGYNEKDGIKATVKIKAFSPEEELAAVIGLHKARGKFVLITVASVDDYRGGRDAETDPDQPAMEFEAGEPEPDEEDEELEGGEDAGEA